MHDTIFGVNPNESPFRRFVFAAAKLSTQRMSREIVRRVEGWKAG